VSSTCSQQSELILHHFQQHKSANNAKKAANSQQAMMQLCFESKSNKNASICKKKVRTLSSQLKHQQQQHGSSSSAASAVNSDDDDDYETTITTTTLLQDDPIDDDDLNNNNCDVNNKNKCVTFSENSIIGSKTTSAKSKMDPKSASKNARTPPHKKFRKLRLFDTAHTPKTLIKKSKLVATTLLTTDPQNDPKKQTNALTTTTTNTNANVTIPKKSVTIASNVSVAPVLTKSSLPMPIKVQRNVSTPVNIAVSCNSNAVSPPHNQLFKTSKLFNDIFEEVHRTPKSLRRTPKLTFKQNHAQSPSKPQTHEQNPTKQHEDEHAIDEEITRMEIDFVQQQQQTQKSTSRKYSITKSRLISTTSSIQQSTLPNQNLRMKLFDQDTVTSSSTTSSANKILNFDDTDNEDEYLKTTGSLEMKDVMFEHDHKVLGPPKTPSAVNTSLFRPVQKSGTPHLISSSSSNSSQNFHMSHHSFQHHHTHHHQRTNSNSSCTSASSVCSSSSLTTSTTFQCQNNCPSNASHNSTCQFSNHHVSQNRGSPHSPFQFNQQQPTNINPFTPTNSFDNSKLTSASNAAAMVKLAMTARVKSQNEVLLSTSLTSIPPPSTLANSETDQSGNVETIADEDIDLNSSHNNNNNNNKNGGEHGAKSLPKNKRLALRQCLVSRYHEEFHEVCKLGSGEFGDVFKCINRLDGCTYAIKRSKKPIAGSALEESAWTEVCAHAILVKHNHIVQYYSAWAEADRMLIQNEYCNGGSLAEFIESLKMNNMNCESLNQTASASSSTTSTTMTLSPLSTLNTNSNLLMMNESDLKILLMHIAKGLAYMHSLNLVHLDIKPGNIFICRTPRRIHHHDQRQPSTSSMIINEESGIDSDEMDEDVNRQKKQTGEVNSLFSEVITYKIGDLGHVTSTLEPHVEEGDCRYLPNEILQEQYDHLQKADVFALALTVFVCGSLEELPKNGDEWHWIRQGNLKDLTQCSDRFKKLLLHMIHENPTQRPSANTLVHHPCICPDATKSKAQLRQELNQEKFKNEMIQRKLKKNEQQNEMLMRKVKKYEQQMNQHHHYPQQIDSPMISTTTVKRPFNFSNKRLTENESPKSPASANNNNSTTTSKFGRSFSSSLL
jgi:wee1-like protein kinase